MYCYFQDIQTQKIIGRGKWIGGLYILTMEETVVSAPNNHQVLSAKVMINIKFGRGIDVLDIY